ncbi:pantoate--beta-alanine ligase [Olivibacter sp. SDN3]|uniref:pantoate--beta-alanine ligase n=1 Tax=Olivibacter sp. SDN3 TaxID=2764720 RepID=UPI001650EC34|nr:pantoate--beta-alanine ligase [Olivibacter sp. SDN3]QNL51427.1 pantoate--beta-alanine ligase [Olivibacter sp. SDN3]
MKIISTKLALQAYLSAFKRSKKQIGFVPTMGALHAGHLSLIERSKAQTAITVCSIFVNPTQFNDPADLEKYPRPIAHDRQLLQTVGCDVLFLPEVKEMYPDDQEQWEIDLGGLERRWEGAHRPGHYEGVTQIVKKLFDVVQPDSAFFGQKDYQQCLIIQHMIERLHLPVKLVIGKTLRDADGLALSSRNVRLSPKGREQALALSRALFMVQEQISQKPLAELRKMTLDFLQQADGVKLEYFAICNAETLEEITSDTGATSHKRIVVLVAAWVDNVRLIDNVLIDNTGSNRSSKGNL